MIIEDYLNFCDQAPALEEGSVPDLSTGENNKAYIAIRRLLGNERLP